MNITHLLVKDAETKPYKTCRKDVADAVNLSGPNCSLGVSILVLLSIFFTSSVMGVFCMYVCVCVHVCEYIHDWERTVWTEMESFFYSEY